MRARLEGCNLFDANLSQSNLYGCHTWGARLDGSTFAGAEVKPPKTGGS